MSISIIPYTSELTEDWYEFVINRSRNGWIFQKELFSYHPEGRFNDVSLVFRLVFYTYGTFQEYNNLIYRTLHIER